MKTTTPMQTRALPPFLLAQLAALALAACTVDDGTNPNARPYDGGASRRDSGIVDVAPSDAAAGLLRPFAPPPANPGSGAILFTASGEVLALGGYPFPPTSGGASAFVDGWEVQFTHVIVTVDKITLSENPDKSPTDQSQADGVVATVAGPWAIDLHKGGPIAGKGGSDEQSVAIAALTSKADGSAFDPTARYAFGFDAVPATTGAMNVNLDAQGLDDYRRMIDRGVVVLYVGVATFKGGAGCSSPSSAYDFSKLPKVVNFELGFQSPTTYANCQNPDDDPAKPFASEEHQRGIQVRSSTFVIGQLTFHTDHPFWESVLHDSPAHFDPIAARYLGSDPATATLDDFIGVDFSAFKDSKGAPLPWRTCLPSYTAKSGTMGFDALGIPVDPSAAPDRALRDYRDFVLYNQSTQGHLNSNGLCFVKRNYPSPR